MQALVVHDRVLCVCGLPLHVSLHVGTVSTIVDFYVMWSTVHFMKVRALKTQD